MKTYEGDDHKTFDDYFNEAQENGATWIQAQDYARSMTADEFKAPVSFTEEGN